MFHKLVWKHMLGLVVFLITFTANLLHNQLEKEFWKSVKIWHEISPWVWCLFFLWNTVYNSCVVRDHRLSTLALVVLWSWVMVSTIASACWRYCLTTGKLIWHQKRFLTSLVQDRRLLAVMDLFISDHLLVLVCPHHLSFSVSYLLFVSELTRSSVACWSGPYIPPSLILLYWSSCAARF